MPDVGHWPSIEVPDRIVQRGIRGLQWARNPDFSYDYHIFFSYKDPTDALSKPPGSLGRSQVCNAALYLWGDRRTTLKIIELKPGSPHGAFRSHPNTPCVYPRRRIPSSIPAGTVKPWIILASTAMYMK